MVDNSGRSLSGEPVRGEMDVAVLAQLIAHRRRAARLEIERLHPRARRRERQNLLGLLPREWQSGDV
jgi:hypothetical protein